MKKIFKANFPYPFSPPMEESSKIDIPSNHEIYFDKTNKSKLNITIISICQKCKFFFIMRFLCWICEFLSKKLKKNKTSRIKTKENRCITETNQTFIEKYFISNNFFRFIKKLLLVQKAMKLFKMRTRFRRMDNFNENDKYFIENLLSNVKTEIKNPPKFKYIKDKRIRSSILYIRRFSKKFLKGC